MLIVAQWETARLAGIPVLAMVLAALVVGFRDRELPAWFRWVSVAFLIPLAVALVPAVGPSGGLAVLGTLWVVVASVFFAVERIRK
jgi:O-antigen/teichoic acid export membrane protein